MIIAFEGIDRIGKSTQAKLLANSLGCDVIKFPLETDFTGKRIREILQGKHPFEPAGFQALNIMNKVNARDTILAYEQRDGNVALDRYKLSNIVYAHADDLPVEWILEEARDIPEPDLTILLRGYQFEQDQEYYGSMEKQARISALYYQWYKHLSHKNPGSIKLIDANRPIDVVQKDILDYVSKAQAKILAGAKLESRNWSKDVLGVFIIPVNGGGV